MSLSKSRSLVVRAIVVAAMALIGLYSPAAAAAPATGSCNTSYCSNECSIIGCVADAACAPSGSCLWDPSCNGPKVTCHNPQ